MKKSVNLLLILIIFFGFMLSFNFIAANVHSGDSENSGSGSSDSGDDSDSGDSSDGDSGSASGSEDDPNNNDSNSDDEDSNGEENEDDKSKENSNDGSDEDDDKSRDEKKTETTEVIIDENGNEVTIKTETETDKNGDTETKETRTYIDENGNKIKIVIKTETEEGESKTEEKRTITSSDGTRITFKTETEIEDGESVTKTSVKVKGTEFNTKLSIKESFEEGEAKLSVKLSTGADQEIIVQPDEALLIAIEELEAGNISIELSENVGEENIKTVFKATTTQEGKFLGIFNTQVDLETLIDTNTGEIIKTTRPWWAFLVIGTDEETMCHIPDGDESKRTIITVVLTEVKVHLEHGDSVGACVVECGDGILVEGNELCETGDTQVCTTAGGYSGTETCSATCDAFNECLSSEFCGDNIINGLEACDDGNSVNGDGCDSLCQVEIAETPPPETNNTNSSV